MNHKQEPCYHLKDTNYGQAIANPPAHCDNSVLQEAQSGKAMILIGN